MEAYLDKLVVDKCCGFIDLRLGSLYIGYLGLVSNCITLFFGIFGAISMQNKHNKEQYEKETGRKLSIPFIYFGLVVTLMNIAFLVLLLLGIYKNNRKYIFIYMVFALFSIVIAICAILYSLVAGRPILHIIGESCSVVLSIYFLVVIRSYYLLLGSQPPGPAMFNNPPSPSPTLPMSNKKTQQASYPSGQSSPLSGNKVPNNASALSGHGSPSEVSSARSNSPRSESPRN